MGIMRTATSTYISNRQSIWDRIKKTFQIIGYSRAAKELAQLGYIEEAKNCMMQVKSLRD